MQTNASGRTPTKVALREVREILRAGKRGDETLQGDTVGAILATSCFPEEVLKRPVSDAQTRDLAHRIAWWTRSLLFAERERRKKERKRRRKRPSA